MKLQLLRVLFVLMSLMIIGCENEKQGKAYILKQWHLSPSVKTSDIEKSKQNSQFQSQKETYLMAKKMIQHGQVNLVIAEGCENEITLSTLTNFNGWTMKKLAEYKDDPVYDDILAPIPMKLKVLYPKLKVICGDDLKLIKKNQLAMSDLRGFFGFYTRLLENLHKKPLVFENYASELSKLYPNAVGDDPIGFAREKSIVSLKSFTDYIHKRNDSFAKVVSQNVKSESLIIIGGLHAEDLKTKLSSKVPTEILVAGDYPEKDKEYLEIVQDLLSKKLEETKLHLLAVPTGFLPDQFPLDHLIVKSELLTPSEEDTLKRSISTLFPFELVLSDFDKDGIRDFTVATKKG